MKLEKLTQNLSSLHYHSFWEWLWRLGVDAEKSVWYRSKDILLPRMMMKKNLMNCFCGMVDWRKAFSLISSWGHCQRSSPSRIPWAGLEPAQNLSSGLVECSCAVVITTTPRRHMDKLSAPDSLLKIIGSNCKGDCSTLQDGHRNGIYRWTNKNKWMNG